MKSKFVAIKREKIAYSVWISIGTKPHYFHAAFKNLLEVKINGLIKRQKKWREAHTTPTTAWLSFPVDMDVRMRNCMAARFMVFDNIPFCLDFL